MWCGFAKLRGRLMGETGAGQAPAQDAGDAAGMEVVGVNVQDLSPQLYLQSTIDAILMRDFITGLVKAFVFGTIVGSFLNVCIYRIPARKSVVYPGSHCYSCGSPVQWYDNVPLLSYVLLRGNCRHCGTHFSPRYFFVELLTGLLFLAVFISFGFRWETGHHNFNNRNGP